MDRTNVTKACKYSTKDKTPRAAENPRLETNRHKRHPKPKMRKPELETLQTLVPHIPLLGDMMQLSAIKLVRPCTRDSVDKEKQAGHHAFR